MNYGFELMSEIIPLCIVAVLGIDTVSYTHLTLPTTPYV